jgi:hypothetical protein
MRLLSVFRILLDLRKIDADDKARATLVNGILQSAPKARLYGASPTIQAEVGNLKTTYDNYVTAEGQAAATLAKLKVDIAARNKAKLANNLSINLLRTLTEGSAAEANDITEMAFQVYTGAPPKPALEPPAVIDVKPGKRGSGKAEVVVHETGTRQHYAAQWSPNGQDPWAALVGSGKSRKVSGKSGTSIYVRFALQLGQQLSAWSAAIQVSFP